MDFSNLFDDEAEVAVPITNGGTVTLKYRPSKFTTRLRLNFDEKKRNHETFALAFCEMVFAWDLTDKGKPFPLTRENVYALPDKYLIAWLQAIMEDMNAPEASAATAESS